MTIAFFPGQGAQHVGMGRDLHAGFGVVRETFEEASDAIGVDLRKLCFDGPESDLTLTENTQPCLLTVSVAAFRAAQAETGFRPAVVAGHSLGEYSALVAAGVLPLAAAVRWVRERGRAMQKAVPAGEGSMAAIMGLEDDAVAGLCKAATTEAAAARASDAGAFTVDAVVEPANFNAPGQTVIAGSADAVARAVTLAGGGTYGSGKAIPLQVSAPFHCRLMAPARDRMAELFSQASDGEKPRAMDIPYVPNRTARLTSEPGVVLEMLVEQVDHPVLWKQSVLALLEAGHTNGVEFGPGKVLQGLGKRIARSVKGKLDVLPMGVPADLKALESIT